MGRSWTDIPKRARHLKRSTMGKDSFPTSPSESRTIYVNMAIPAEDLDDYGQPRKTFASNRIRTAKYTWFTFLPKNLFEQFRGIANLYFLFLVILQMIPIFSTSASPILVILPLAAILIITGAKDAVEDYKRQDTDERVNNATTYTLKDYRNINVPQYKIARWRRWLHSLQNALRLTYTHVPVPGHSPTPTRSTLAPTSSADQGSPAPKASSFRNSIQSSTSSFTRVFLKRRMPYRPGQIPHSVLTRSPSSKLRDHMASPAEAANVNPEDNKSVDPLWESTPWQDIAVGDFVYLRNNDIVPADIAVLSTSEPDGLCYVETQNLDGETNLKIKRSLQATMEIKSPKDCGRVKFYVESEPPQANLYSYNGVLKWKVEMPTRDDLFEKGSPETMPSFPSIDSMGTATVIPEVDEEGELDENTVSHEKTEAITGASLLLRGCVLRNTEWVIGLAIFTGNETRIMLNSGKTPSKRSKMEKATNPHVIANFVLLFVLCMICSVASSIYFTQHSSSTYFEYRSGTSSLMEGFLMFWVSLVIYQNIIPISLYISVQIVKTASAYFIHTDIDMYNDTLDQPCIPKTWNISDDLGQIEYIFSDKTGTLTQNIMEFRKCTIHGVAYGLGETEASLGARKRRENGAESDDMDLEEARRIMLEEQAKLFSHPYTNPTSSFVDPVIYSHLAQNDGHANQVIDFFSALALCHTVLPEIPDPDQPHHIVYKAQSPDEAALVATARDVGFTFLARDQDTLWIDVMGKRQSMVLLHVLEFNSSRKRMSVILRSPDDGQILLLCKGADSVIYTRLTPDADQDQQHVRDQTTRDLNVFSNQGLRTLCIAKRTLSEEEYATWAERYQIASSSIYNRDEQIEAVCDDIEQSLTLLGGTAIEDKLQQGVPDTIALLAKAGIKIWVLTGDKVETAINIGFACNLLTKDMFLIQISASNAEETLAQLKRSQKEMSMATGRKSALVIDGESLKFALEERYKSELLALSTCCSAVLCCRVSPMQKANVVRLVKKGLRVMTLAIGDGANDVSMIQEANVGVGISGEEGRQAVMASDYAIAQFRYLSKLLLVHGRWSYLRTSEMILTFFYKNIMWTLVLFWYQIFCSFSGSMMFDYSYITLYNLVFTSLPCIFAGVLDQDLTAAQGLKYPQLYMMGIRNDKFRSYRFYLTVLDAIYQSAVCFGVPYLVFVNGKMSSRGYDTEGVYELGTFIAGIAVVIANGLVGMTLFSWTWIMVLVIVLSSATFFIWTAIYSNVMTFTFFGEDMLFREGMFWLCLIITFTICMFPRMVASYVLHVNQPYDNDIIRERMLCKPKRHSKKMYALDDEVTPIAHAMSEQSIALGRSMSESRVAMHASSTLAGTLGDSDVPLIEPPRRSFHIGSASANQAILHMQSGEQTSLRGFAFSSDDVSVFDQFRQSVYRRCASVPSRRLFRHASMSLTSSPVAALRSPLTSKDNTTYSHDSTPSLEGLPLRRFDTAPEPGSDTGRDVHEPLGAKMMHAVRQHMKSQHRRQDSFTHDVELAEHSHSSASPPHVS